MMTPENDYLSHIYDLAKQRDPHKPEFHQALLELLIALTPVIEKTPSLCKRGILERLIEPERLIQFRVAWRDRDGETRVNRGYRVQFNSALGPYKGGLRFHPTVNSSIIKFLGFEQTFKNSLTGLPIGGAKGGSDFDPRGKTDNEVMSFCQSFMSELFRHIGASTDVPAGDIGVGNREIGYLYGEYCRLMNISEGAMTGKGIFAGGSMLRTEATGYGLCYFAESMLAGLRNGSLKGKTIIISGSGNVALYAIKKAQAFGARVIAASDSGGYIIDESGIDWALLRQIKERERGRISEYASRKPGASYHEGCSGIWSVPCDVAMPCATQNEISLESAQQLINNGAVAILEGSNMSCTFDAVQLIMEEPVLYVPAKAANAGGVAVSGLEMAQNAGHASWSYEKVDDMLQSIMNSIFHRCIDAAVEYGHPENLLIGANIAGFVKVSKAMAWQGVV
ncbi:MAG: NADP-specific glutamate dehydrogenase [Bacillota bacterium]|nr:NADP-specific glutamate dehydrogenase [Bacillota bacterium]